MEAVMKSIIPAALVVILEAGFIATLAALPTPPGPVQWEMTVAGHPAPAPAIRHSSRPASRS
jgi:hypothetical protein